MTRPRGAAASSQIGHEVSPLGSGGMRSKVVAAEMATAAGIPTVIASGLDAGRGRAGVGRRARRDALRAAGGPPLELQALAQVREAVAGHASPSTPGAARALREGGTSLLPVGIVDVAGEFDAGDAVEVREAGAAASARGSPTTRRASCAA